MRSTFVSSAFLLLVLSAFAGPTSASAQEIDLDTVRAGRFDYGKMWTFENPPSAYFTERYGFDADAAWFERARAAALRLPGCSAAFVSPHGLVVTNHHCIRGAIEDIARPREVPLDAGFYARSLEEERPIPGYYVDQLIAVADVSDEVLAAVDRATGDEARRRARDQAMGAVRDRLLAQHAGDPDVLVQVVPLYQGGRFSAYSFRRYTDVRLVAAAELEVGFFGGDPDNFTYPRYALDFGFLRIYGADGRPLRNPDYFGWSEAGVQAEDVVFVIGNPGPTNRLSTMAQLEFRRDVLLPAQARIFDARIRALWDFYAEDPGAADALGLRNDAFSLSNSWKQYVGQIEALSDPAILARKRDAEQQLRDSISARPELSEAYGPAIDRIADIQPSNRALAPYFDAFLLWANPVFESVLLRRAVAAQQIGVAETRGVPADTIAVMRERLREIPDLPLGLERRMLVARLRDFTTLPPNDEVRRIALGGATPEEAAERLLAGSSLASAEGTAAALSGGLDPRDPALRIAEAVTPRVVEYASAYRRNGDREAELGALLGRARFEIYGTAVPPEGSSSPRITDGVVRGYEYNGTLAPPYTTFFGMYDRHHAHAGADWALPERWLPVPPELDLGTPLNFVSTADTYGGNSGSPAVTPDLALVGLNFDRNIQGMTRNFIYLPEQGRNIMVDVRAIREALDDVYDADRIVLEVLTHRLYESEDQADAAQATF
jgi:hypothetical protein